MAGGLRLTDDRPLRETDPIAADRRTDTPAQVASVRPAVPAGWDEAADLEKDPAVVPQLAETEVPEGLRREIEEVITHYPERRSAVLPALHAAQRVHGWCSPEALRQVAAVMRVTPAYLSSITTFYDMFNTEPVGRRYIYACTSVACNLVGAQQVYRALEGVGEQLDDVHVREAECLGACDMAPMASVDGRYVGPLDPSDAPEIATAMSEGRKPLIGRGLEAVDQRAPDSGSDGRSQMADRRAQSADGEEGSSNDA